MDKTSLLKGNTCQRVFLLFQQYREELLLFVNRRLHDRVQSEALLSDVLMKMHRQCEQLTHVKNIRAWLFQVARNTINDYFREQAKQAEKSVQNLADERSWESAGPEALASLIPALMTCLPEKYAQPLLMSDLEGISQKDIATQLNLSVSAVKSRVQRGRRKLKALFYECLYLELDQQGVPMDYRIKPLCESLSEMNENEDCSCQ